MSPKELISLLKNNEGPAADDFTSTVDKIASLINVAKNLDPGGSPQNGFMDVLAALAGNRDLGAAAMRLVGSKMGAVQPQQPQLPAQAQKIQEFQKNLIAARYTRTAERRKFEEEKRQFAARASGGALGDTTADAPETVETPPTTSQTTGSDGADAKNNASGVEQLPPQTREFLDGISKAPDESHRCRALVDFLLYFQTDENTKSFAENTMRNIREGNRAKALHNLYTLFNVFVSDGFMSAEVARATLKLLNTHAEEFQKVFADVRLESDSEVTRDSLMAPAPGVAAQ